MVNTEKCTVLFHRRAREPENPDWQEVQSVLLDDGLAVFPQGMMRFVNTSQRTIAVILGEARPFEVEPGEYLFRKSPAEKSEMVMAQKDETGAWKTFFRNEVSLENGQRYHVYAYDGDHPDRPVQLFLRPEQVGNGLVIEKKANGELTDSTAEKSVLVGSIQKSLKGNLSSEVDEDRGGFVSCGDEVEELSESELASSRMRTGIVKSESSHREHLTEPDGLQEGVTGRLNVMLEIVLLVVFVGLLIWWGLRVDWFRWAK
jgi:hypothetical protein